MGQAAKTQDTRPLVTLVEPKLTTRLRMPSLTEAARRLDRPVPPAVDPEPYAVLKAVWRTYPQAARTWRTVIPPDQLTGERWAGLTEGRPLLDETMVQWDAVALRDQHRRVLKVFHSTAFSHLEALSELKRRLTLHFCEPVDWARCFFRAEVNDPRPEALLGGYLLQPFLYALARDALPHLLRVDRRRTRCPVCGGAPYHSYLHSQSRQKILICGKCQCPWIAPRLECPFCANTRQESLGYFFTAEFAEHRIDYCARCRSILPMSPYPEAGSPFPLYDHLVTMPLQQATERRGHDA